jgi:hypothetical protein
VDVIIRKFVDLFCDGTCIVNIVFLKFGCIQFLLYVIGDILVLVYCLLVTDVFTWDLIENNCIKTFLNRMFLLGIWCVDCMKLIKKMAHH